MSAFERWMGRFGWVKLASHGLRLDEQGMIVWPSGQSTSSTDFTPPTPEQHTPAPHQFSSQLPSLLQPAVANQAAPQVAPQAAIEAAPQEPTDRAPQEAAGAHDDSEEDDEWEWVMAAARARANAADSEKGDDAPTIADLPRQDLTAAAASHPPTLPAVKSAPVQLPLAPSKPPARPTCLAAGSMEMPAQGVSFTVPAAAPQVHQVLVQGSESEEKTEVSEEEEWERIRAAAEERMKGEQERKRKAMLEVQRLHFRTRAPAPRLAKPPRRRLAQGTEPPESSRLARRAQRITESFRAEATQTSLSPAPISDTQVMPRLETETSTTVEPAPKRAFTNTKTEISAVPAAPAETRMETDCDEASPTVIVSSDLCQPSIEDDASTQVNACARTRVTPDTERRHSPLPSLLGRSALMSTTN